MKLPFIDGHRLEDIASRFPTPFYLYDERRIRQNARDLLDAFSWNPGFKEYFAVKANPNPVLLRILKEEGCGADCASLTELMTASAVGFRGADIMFSANVPPIEDVQLAAKLDALVNLDDLRHIDFWERAAKIQSTVVLRLNPGNGFTIGNDIMSRPGEAKYGFTPTQLEEGVRSLMRRGVERFGLHAFLSSNTTDHRYYPALAALLFETAAALHKDLGADIISVNLSGGIGIPYRPGDAAPDIREIGSSVRAHFDEILRANGLSRVAVHTELGRWMLGPAGCLVSRVIHEKHTYKNFLGLDACAADLLRPAMYKAYHHITVAGREQEPDVTTWDVTGGLCENNDKFAIDRPLPRVTVGDLVVLHDAGAHARSMGYNYNGKLRPAELLLQEDGDVRMIRRAETPADYFATLDVLEDFSPTL